MLFRSSNVDGTIAVIKRLNLFDSSVKLVATKGIIELGSEKESSYKKILDLIGEYGMKLLTTDKTFNELEKTNNVRYFRSESGMVSYLKENLNEDTALLIEGRFTDSFLKRLGVFHE